MRDPSDIQDFQQHVDRAVRRLAERTANPRPGLVAAVSGGPDSVVLLHALAEAAGRGLCCLRALHVDHAIRPVSADDADFVDRLCRRLDVPLDSVRIDVPARAAADRTGLEETARNVRREQFDLCLQRHEFTAVATGHHRDDNVETILHKVLRGTGLRGMAGMEVCSSLDAGGLLFRPLLELSRGQILAFAEATGLSWRADSTNADTRLTRNCLRHEVLPLLREQINPQVDQAILRASLAARQAADWLDQLARPVLERAELRRSDRAVSLRLDVLAEQPDPCLVWCFQRLLEALPGAGETSAVHYEQLVDLVRGQQGNRQFQLPGLLARRQGDRILLEPAGPTPQEVHYCQTLREGDNELPDGQTVRLETIRGDSATVQQHLQCPRIGVELLDADRISGPLQARPRLQGDRFLPLGAPGSQSVSDFLTNARLGPAERQAVRCVLDQEGIVYLAPLRLAHRVRLTGKTRRVLRISWNCPTDGNLG
ncbi:MAG: tRNA lysidine(34) synthetase TilS [Phycisphaerae bacterium]